MKTKYWDVLVCLALATLTSRGQLGPPGDGGTNSIPTATNHWTSLDPLGAQWAFQAIQTNAPVGGSAPPSALVVSAPTPVTTIGEIQIQTDGAVAQFAPHKAFFAPNPNTSEAVQLIIPSQSSQVLLKSHVVGIGFWDSNTGETVVFATPQDCIGEVSGATVRYTNALDGTDAEITYTYAWDSFDQTVILRKKIPEPSTLNMTGDPAKIRLVVITEFVDPPEPIRLPGAIDLTAKNQLFGIQSEDSIPDETLFFGSMRMAAGKMLLLGDSTVEVPSGKTFINVDGSHYLVEFCPWLLVRALVDSLPSGTLHAKAKARGNLKSLMAQLPKPKSVIPGSPKMRLVPASSKSGLALNQSRDTRPGVVLDYLLVSSHLIDVDLSGASPEKQGVAAVGRFTNDFWITWISSNTSKTNLLWSDQSASGIGLTISNAPGGWGNGANDPMYNSYLYGSPPITMTLTNLPTNVFHFYLYGHAGRDVANSSFKLLRGGTQIAYKGTTLWGNTWNSTNWEPGIQYQVFKSIAVTNQTIQFQIPAGGDGYPYVNGLQIVESAAVPPPPTNITNLFNVNFGSPSTNKVGFAAVGLATNDYWNGYYNSSNLAGSIIGLTNANGTASAVGLTVLNAPGLGSWNGGGNGDGMYSSFVHATNGGNVTVLLTNLTTGNYDFYLYGHGNTNDANTIFQLWSGGRDWDVRGTTIWGSGYSNSAAWDESQQYVAYHDIPVDSNQVVTIVAGHDPYGSANLNGMQIVYKGSYDTNSDGLPDVWKWYYFGSTSTAGTTDSDSDKLSNFREFQLGTDPTKSDTDGNGLDDADDSEWVWVEDASPLRGQENDASAASPSWSGAYTESWNWTDYWGDGWGGAGVGAYSWNPYSSCYCMHVSDTHSGIHQHWFDKSVVNMMANTGEVLITYVNIDPDNPPAEIMLQWYATETNGLDSWEHRAYWGSNAIAWGATNTASRWYVTNLPTAGNWARLEVPASAVGLEGKVIQGMAFTLYNGRAAFDRAGKFIPDMDGNGLTDSWEQHYFGSIGQDPNGDPDHDGLSNLDELRGGTNPTNCNSPQISGQPQNSCGYLGGSAYFIVTPTGSVLTNYHFQWRLGGTNITSATNYTLVITDIQSTNVGNYTVVITNVCGSITSSVATLTFCPPPYVQITVPTNNATFTAPAFVAIQATTTNTDSSITNVEFYRGNLFLLSHTTASPYSYTWTAAAGQYSLTAVAYDSHGLISTSSPVSITVGSACSYTNNTFSSNNAFGNGFLMNLNYTNSFGRLQLNAQATPFPFINVACGPEGTLVRVDTSSGQILGEYLTTPTNKPSYPGHVAVDRYGNAWVANWDEAGNHDGTGLGSITRIGVVIGGIRGDVQKNQFGVVTNFVVNTNTGHYLKPPFLYSTAVDRDGDGYIKTSYGINDVLSWPTNSIGGTAGSVSNADDELIINYIRIPAQLASALAVDANNDLWVGGYCDFSTPDLPGTDNCGTKIHVKVNGVTGEVLTTNTAIQFTNVYNGTLYGGFEGLVAPNGFLWSSGGVNGGSDGNYSLVTFDPVARTNLIRTQADGPANYGMAIDPLTGYIWVASYSGSNVSVYSQSGALLATYAHGNTYGSGLAIDNSSNVWVAHGPFNGGTTISHLRTDGTILGIIDLTNGCPSVTPVRELCYDAAGKLWATCVTSPYIVRFNPIYGTNELCLAIHTEHQTRGDLTGQKLLAGTAPSGIWSVIYTNGTTNIWGTLTWTASTTDTNQIRVEVRAANTYGQLSTNSFQLASDSVLLNNVVGQLLEIRVTLIKPAGNSASPWLHDLTVDCTAATAPVVQITSPANNQMFVFSPTNIPITVTGSDAFGTITNVAFYVGSTLIGQTNQPPYQCLWTNVTFSTNTITAKATNNYGLWATSSVTNIVVNAMPLVTFLQPVTNTTAYREVTNVFLQVTNYDADGAVTNVVFRCSGTNIGGTILHSNSVWGLYWSNRLDGKYAITAVATDDRGASSSSVIRVFNVNPINQPPSVQITYPADGGIYPAGSDITIMASATNFPAMVTNVSFYANGLLLGSDPDLPYSLSVCCWKPGTYLLSAKADDSLGSHSATNITITIADEPPSGQGFWDAEFGQQLSKLSSAFGGGYAVRRMPDGTLYAFGDYEAARSTNGLTWVRDQSILLSPPYFPGDDNQILQVGNNLYFTDFGDDYLTIQRWDGTNLVELGNRLFGSENGACLSVIAGDLYVGGDFTSAGSGADLNTNVHYVAKLDSSSNRWLPVTNGITNGVVYAIAAVGSDVYIGGSFTAAGGNTNANYLIRLVQGGNTNLASGVSAVVDALSVCNTNLFVGGYFQRAGSLTNAQGVAVWNGKDWRTLNGGAGSIGTAAPQVYTIVAHGERVYVGGTFTNVIAGGDIIPARDIAMATWNESSQSWLWSDLDLGLQNSGSDWVSDIALAPGPTADKYDVYVTGGISFAGKTLATSISFARWRVGYPQPPSAPLVTITNPAPGAVLTNPASINIAGFASSGYTNLSTATVFVDGDSIGGSLQMDGSFSATWNTPLTGVHEIVASAKDRAALQGQSRSVLITIKGTSTLARDDTFTIPQGGQQTTLPVLTNDVQPSTLHISRVIQTRQDVGKATVAFDGTSISYLPLPNAFGIDTFAYTVTNSSGATDSAWVTVHILTKPIIEITQPNDGARFRTGSVVTVSCNVADYDGVVTNVALVLNSSNNIIGALATNSAGFSWSTTWSTNVPGYYTFRAFAVDNDGLTNWSAPVTVALTNVSPSSNGPVAQFTDFSPVQGPLGAQTVPLVQDGITNIFGTAMDPDGDPVSYALFLYRPEDLDFSLSDNPNEVLAGATPFLNLTPASRNFGGFREVAVTNSSLGAIDLTTLPNGTYYLDLRVRGGTDETNSLSLFRLDSNLKIGQFSFSEQDLVIPVNGIPLTVTRTYNSLNSRTADFGYSWTYALNSMDVQLDEERQDVTIGADSAPFADDEEDANGLPKVVSIRTGGGWNVTLNLPDGRRTTFAFTPDVEGLQATAKWTPPPDVHATLTPIGLPDIEYFPNLHWWSGGDNSTFDNHDVPGWILGTLDGTKYHITRGSVNNITYVPDPNSPPINVQAYGPPQLTQIEQRNGDTISISDKGILHYHGSTTNRSVLFDRDAVGRITEIWDPNSLSNTPAATFPAVRYVYNQDTGNLIQVLKLVDRSTGGYVTNKYHYDNPNFPHYITSVENPLGIPVGRNFYDDAGRLTAIQDADGNLTQFIHDTANNIEIHVDRMHNTNTFVYDSHGNITAHTNALLGVTLSTFDDNNNKTSEIQFLNGQPYATNHYAFSTNSLLLASYDPLGRSNVYTYNDFGQVLTSLTPCGCSGTTNYYDPNTGYLVASSDALGNTTSNFHDSATGLLRGTQDPLGNITTNYFDDSGNLIATALLQAGSLAALSTNSFAYDDNGNQTNSVVWRRVSGVWVGATNIYVLDGQNRAVQTIDPLGYTNSVFFDAAGRHFAAIDKLGRGRTNVFDFQGHAIKTIYPDGFFDQTQFDAIGNATNRIDRAGHATTNFFDALQRKFQTVFADGATNLTVFDDLGRVKFTVDARGTTNAFGYDVAGQRTAVTNGWSTAAQTWTLFGFDINGNNVTVTNALGIVTTNVFDPLNRQTATLLPDRTKVLTGFDAAGRKFAVTNQDGFITFFGMDGAGRLTSVTNALGTAQQIVTQYEYDEAGNETAQIDGLNRTNKFESDSLGHRTKHTMPGGQVEGFSFDPNGNGVYYTNFNSVVITNRFDLMNQLTNRASTGGFQESFAYDPAGNRTNMMDMSGTTSYELDPRYRLKKKTVAWSGGPTIALNYGWDGNGNLTNLSSSSTGGVANFYQWDPINRLTNTTANGTLAARYGFDVIGNMTSIGYGNGVTNLSQFDSLNRLTNTTWKSNELTLASFYYQFGPTGNRTNLTETLLTSLTNRTYAWGYDSLYRLTSEAISGIGSTTYGIDRVGNRTNRTAGLDSLPAQNFSYGTNDWLVTDAYDSNGNTLWSTNSGTSTNGPYYYDVRNRLTNFNNSVYLGYNGDGMRMTKTANGTNFFYLLDDQNPSGYAQVLEEWAASGGSTNLIRAYNYGFRLISQRQPAASTNYFVFDGHGSTRALTDSSGIVVNTFVFDAYGVLISSNSPPQTAYLYCGEQLDPVLGMYYNRTRYLDPAKGRFFSRDKFEGNLFDPMSCHKYIYAHSDPINRLDPEGEQDSIMEANWEAGAGLDSMGSFALKTVLSCGANITSQLDQTLLDVKQTYGNLKPKSKKKKACKNILGSHNIESGSNWDINWLINLASGYKGTPCLRTVTYAKKCIRDDALWYSLFGVAAASCKQDFPNDFGDPMQDLLNGLVKRAESGVVKDSDEFIGNKVEVANHFFNNAKLTDQNSSCPCQTAGPKDAKIDLKDWHWDGVK